METEGARNARSRPVGNPSRLGLVLALLLCAAGVGYCASGKKGTTTTAVYVAHHPQEVRGCSFLGRLTGPSGDEPSGSSGEGSMAGHMSELSMQERVAEMGGNVLLLLPAGTGEAWYCEQTVHVYAPPANPTPRRPILGKVPTAPATPRT